MANGDMEASLSEGVAVVSHTHNGTTTLYSNIGSTQVLLESKFSDLGSPMEKRLDGMVLEIGSGSFAQAEVFVGIKQRLKDTPTWYGPFSLQDQDEFIHFDVEDARFFAIRIVDEAPTVVWTASALELYGVVQEGRQ